MAYLSKKEVLEKNYITNIEYASGLVDGTYSLDDDCIKEYINQIGAYNAVYVGPDVDDPTTPDVDEHEQALEEAQVAAVEADTELEEEYIESVPETDDNPDNNIKFTIDDVVYTWEGSPNTRISTVYKKGLIPSMDLMDGEVVVDASKKITTIAGKTLTMINNTENE